MNERLKKLRKELDLTQEEFARKIGIKRNTLATYEIGRNEPIDAVLSLICREFNVSEQWLRSGQGEMFVRPETFSLNDYAKKANLSALEFDIIRGYLDLDADVRRSLMSYLVNVVSKHSEIAATQEESFEDVKARKLREFERELDEEKNMPTSSALLTRKEIGSA